MHLLLASGSRHSCSSRVAWALKSDRLSAPVYEPTSSLPVRMKNGVIQVCDNRWD
jgi:hypothetical protein